MAARYLLVATLSFSAGCLASLEGEWEGEVNCGNGEAPAEVELDESGTAAYEGDGKISELHVDEGAATIEMELEIDQDVARGPQVVDVNADCTLFISGLDPQAMDCSGLTEFGWDGRDRMETEIRNFMGTGMRCDFQLIR